MSFPGPYDEIIRNEAGEVVGWDKHYDDPPEYCDYCGGAHSPFDCPDGWEDDGRDDGEDD
jgi:hypothetical protein